MNQTKRILIVDDEELNRELLEGIVVTSTPEIANLFLREPFDLPERNKSGKNENPYCR